MNHIFVMIIAMMSSAMFTAGIYETKIGKGAKVAVVLMMILVVAAIIAWLAGHFTDGGMGWDEILQPLHKSRN